MKKKKCSKCEKKATFTSPKLYCDLHWYSWWYKDFSREAIIEDIVKLNKKVLKLKGK